MPMLFLLLSFAAFAEPVNVRNLAEQTHTRDNSFCRIGTSRIEIQLRSHAATTERGERKYAEYVFYYTKVKPKLLPINEDKLNSYRFFEGEGTLCSKSLGYHVGPNIAVLFLKENRPYEDKLSFQLFDPKTKSPGAFVETDYLTDKAELAPDGFFFRTYLDRMLSSDLNRVKVAGKELFYQERAFSYWMKYSLKGFETAVAMSFENSPYKKYFKDQKDFLETTGWDETSKTFKNTFIYVAVNHKIKKECLLISDKKIKPDGSESWRCL